MESKIKSIILASGLILFSIIGKGQVTVTETFSIEKDATVSMENPVTNYGDAETIESFIYNGSYSERRRTFFEVDISSIPHGAEILSAKLFFKGINHQGKNESYIQAVAEFWGEETVTYKEQPKLTDFRVLVPQSVSPDQDYEIEIKEIVNKWVNEGLPNYGLALRIGTVELKEANGLMFGSSDNPDASLHPYLVVEYKTDIPKVKLIASDCDLLDMPVNKLLTADYVSFADQYEFYIKEPSTGYSEAIVKSSNQFMMGELSVPVNLNSEYEILVRISVQGQWGNYGQVCKNTTIKNLEFNPCEVIQFSIELNHNILVSDDLTIDINLPQGIIGIDSVQTNNPAAVCSTSITGNNLIISINNVSGNPGNPVLINYFVMIDCEGFQVQEYDTVNYETVLLNGNLLESHNSPVYSVYTPYFKFEDYSYNKRDFNMAHSGVPFERMFHYINTLGSSTDFIGDFKFGDTTDVAYINSAIRILSLDLVYPPMAMVDSISIIVTDITAHAFVRFNAGVDSVIFRENVELIKCPATPNNITHFKASFGCSGGDLCVDALQTIDYTRATFDPNDRPQINYRLITPGYPECLSGNHERIIRVINTGGGNAEFMYIGINPSTGYNISSIQNVEVFSDGTLTAPVAIINEPILLSTDNYVAYKTINQVVAGDTLWVRYDEVYQCLDTSQYDFYFNHGVKMNYERFPYISLRHPCYPTALITYDPMEYSNATWLHDFQLGQFFANLIGAMTDDQEEWFEVENTSPLILSRDGYFIFNPDSSELQVELKLEPGLGLVKDSIYLYSLQGGTTEYLYPFAIEYDLGMPADTGNGNTIVAKFRLKPNYYDIYTTTPPTHGFTHIATNDYDQFFNNFKVKFLLHAYCEHSLGSKVGIDESVLFVPNVDCSQECKIPLSSVGDGIFILCPGCILPGWNLQSFDIKRLNYGFSDSDNNNFPDTYPFDLIALDTSLAQSKHVMIGDTMEWSLAGITSDGDSLRFDNIGIDYKYAQIVFKDELMNELEFLGAEGIFADTTGSYSLFIPPSGGVLPQPGVFYIDLSLDEDHLYSYGVDSNYVKKFWWTNYIELKPKFRVKNNLELGTGIDLLYSLQDIDAVINMSGTEYTYTGTILDVKPDANLLDSAALMQITEIERSSLTYWCTGYNARVVAIGTDIWYYAQYLTGYGPGADPCYNMIDMQVFTDVGAECESYTGNVYHTPEKQTAWNSFSYELRNLWMLDTLTFTFPEYYEVDSIIFRTTQLFFDTVQNKHSYTCYIFVPQSNWSYDTTGNSIITDTTLTIFPAANFDQINEFAGCNGPLNNDFTAYDESKRYRVTLVLKIKDCNMPAEIPVLGKYPVYYHWSNYPGTISGDTIVKKYFGIDKFTSPQATLNTNVLPFNYSSNSDLNWELDVYANNPGNVVYEPGVIIGTAVNSFLMFESESGNIVVDSVLWRQNSNHVGIVGDISGNPLYGLGRIGETWGNIDSAYVRIFASYDCSEGLEDDSLKVFFGWNCFEYPDSLYEVCFLDSLYLPFEPINTGLTPTLIVQDTADVCGSVHYTVQIDPSGVGTVENIQIELPVINQEYYYLPGSAFVLFSGDTLQIEPNNINSDTLIWNLDSVLFMDEFGANINDLAYFTFDIIPNCGFGDNEHDLELVISGDNYCGFQINSSVLFGVPDTITGYPELDSLIISITSEDLTTCGDSSTINVEIHNVGNDVTGEYNIIEVVLPDVFSYLSGDIYETVLGDTLIYSIPENIPPGGIFSYNFEIINNSILNCYDENIVKACVRPISQYTCDTITCDYESEDYYLCVSDTFIIQKPEVSITGISGIFCDTTNYQVTVDLSNISAITADTLTITYLCIENSSGIIDPPCVLGTEEITNLGGGLSTSITSNLTGYCSNCETLVAVVNSNCICEPDTSVIISIPEPFDLILLNTVDVQCFGGNTGEANISVSGGTTPYDIQWSNSGTGYSQNNLYAGNYQVIVTDSMGCTDTLDFQINQNDSIEITVTTTDVLCYGDSTGTATVSVTGGSGSYTYLWSTGGFGITENHLSAGNYSIIVTDGLGCNNVEYFAINQPDTLLLAIDSYIDATCLGICDGQAVISVAGGTAPFVFLWNPSSETTQNATQLCPGINLVNVTDNNGCIASIQVIIGESAPLDVSVVATSETCIGLCNGEINVTINSGTPGFVYYLNGVVVPTLPITGLCSNNYLVEVKDTNGCYYSDTIIIDSGADSIPSAIFDIEEPCLYTGLPIHFVGDTLNADAFMWQFGDGNSSTDGIPVNTFYDDGYYCVSLTVINGCGAANSSQTIYILPDSCSCDSIYGGSYAYTFHDGDVISTYTEWNPTTYPGLQVYVEGDLYLESGAELKIYDLTIYFGPKGRILVDRGALLQIWQTKLTGLPSCGNMWQGIEVWGDPASTIFGDNGHFWVKNEVVFENAHIGILVGKRNLDYICSPSGEKFDIAYSGGKISINESDFFNNGIGIKGTRKTTWGINWGGITLNYLEFTSNNLIDLDYNLTLNPSTAYPNSTNPFVYSTTTGRTGCGIKAEECVFSHNKELDFLNMDTCIMTVNSSAGADECTFTEANFGFYALHTFSGLNFNHEIKNCTFDKIYNNAGDGKAIYIMGGVNDKIYNNDFGQIGSDINEHNIGIQLDFTSDYEITENRFFNFNKGIIATWNFSGFIGANEPSWFGNQFNECRTGIETNWANENLILKCNDHGPTTNPLTYDVNWDNSGVIINMPTYPYLNIFWSLGDQGIDGTNPDDPAGNDFYVPLSKQISSSTTYIYNHHGDAVLSNNYRPELDGSSVFIDRNETGTDYVSNFDACSDVSIMPPLPPVSPSSAPYAEIYSLKSSINNVVNNYINLMNSIDGGETQLLLDAITGDISGGNLKNLLIAHSPLSDTVIYTLMLEDKLSPGNFINVMIQNLPVSNQIVADFYTYINSYPPGIKNQLLQLQRNNPGVITPAGLLRDIDQLNTEYFRLLSKVISALLDSTDYRKEDAIAFLEDDGSVKSKQILFSTYAQDGRYIEAENKLNEIEAFNLYYLDDYVELNRKVILLYKNNKSIYELDSIDFAFIYNLAWKCPPNPAVYIARAIIETITGEHIPYCPKGLQTRNMPVSNSKRSVENSNWQQSEFAILGENYPDPAKNFTIIPYELPVKTNGKIIIKDVLGKIIKIESINSDEFELRINTDDWAMGIYYYSLEVNNQLIDTKKIIIGR